MLGGLLAQVWNGSENGDLTLTEASVYFLAGLAPRFVADRINDAVRRTFLPPSNAVAQSPRTMPLTNIRGVTTLIEDRFYEEGIFDVYGLAMANPFRILSQTPFDKRQVAAWIDEALLMTVLPQSWAALQAEGITGAIDLALYAYADPAEGGVPPVVQRLAERGRADKLLLFDAIKRMAQDTQVQLIWGLYQSITADEEKPPSS
jgi:hypothetical protein